MKGMIFTEFLEMVEDRHGLAAKLQLVDAAGSDHGGAYTAVGNYNAGELVRMVHSHAVQAGVPVAEVLVNFGEHIFAMFVRHYGSFFVDVPDAFHFLGRIEDYIHVEVRKLYPDAELPSFSYPPAPAGTLIMDYRSPRPLAAFAEGLVRAAIRHFGGNIALAVQDLSAGAGTAVRFTLQRPA